MRFASCLSLLVILNSAIPSTHAEVVSFQGGGTYNYFDGSTNQSVPFFFDFSYDTATPAIFSNATQATYNALSFSLTVSLAEGTWTDSATAARVGINNTGSESFQVTSEIPVNAPTFQGFGVSFYKIEFSGGADLLPSTALPSNLSLSGWTSTLASIYILPSNFTVMNATINSLSAVPEPASFGLLSGVLVLGAATLRRRSR